MQPPNWDHIVAIIVASGGGIGWLTKRRDTIGKLRADIETLTTASSAANEAYEAALAAKDAEIGDWRAKVERLETRITQLEDERIHLLSEKWRT